LTRRVSFATLGDLDSHAPDTLVSIRVALWDVRAQWESGLRTLTIAQSCLEKWPATPSDEERQALLDTLQEQVKAMREVNGTVRDLLRGVAGAVESDALRPTKGP
jgi:hypothetical protein